jgi:hypothetical protein
MENPEFAVPGRKPAKEKPVIKTPPSHLRRISTDSYSGIRIDITDNTSSETASSEKDPGLRTCLSKSMTDTTMDVEQTCLDRG